jgi:hypothetical protein
MPGFFRSLLAPRFLGSRLACRVCGEYWQPGLIYCACCCIIGEPVTILVYQDRISRVVWSVPEEHAEAAGALPQS